MYSELDDIAQNIFGALSESTVKHLQYNKPRIRTLVVEQMSGESETVISNITEVLTALIRNYDEA